MYHWIYDVCYKFPISKINITLSFSLSVIFMKNIYFINKYLIIYILINYYIFILNSYGIMKEELLKLQKF